MQTFIRSGAGLSMAAKPRRCPSIVSGQTTSLSEPESLSLSQASG